jgi:integrase
MLAAGKTAGLENIKPSGLSIVRGGRGSHCGNCSARSSPTRCARVIYRQSAHGVVKFATGRRERRLIDDEYPMLGMALTRADQEDIWQSAIAATRLIITGWRRGEVLGLGLSEGDPRNELPDR